MDKSVDLSTQRQEDPGSDPYGGKNANAKMENVFFREIQSDWTNIYFKK